MSETAIKIENLRKRYRLGQIGGTTLKAEIQSWWARKRHLEDPNVKIGEDQAHIGEAFYALDGITLDVKSGEALGIIGANGAGKSTLLKILSRVTAPTEGDIWINGRISSMLEVGTGFHAELTGRENIYMNGAILGMSKKEIDAKIESIIDFSECRQFIDTPVKRYSSGMYVKLAFAVASHLDSEILIMDEVLAVGDMAFQKKSLSKMSDASGNEGKTVLYVSHNMATIRNLCTRCVVLEKGRIVFEGDVEQAIERYMNQGGALGQTVIDNRNKERRFDAEELGRKAMINRLEFANRDSLLFNRETPFEFMVETEAFQDLKQLHMGISVDYSDGTPVGFGYVRIPDMQAGEVRTDRYRMDFSFLPAGNYRMLLNLHMQNSLGNWEGSIDQTDHIYFGVEGAEGDLLWKRDWFGLAKLNHLSYIGEYEKRS